MTVLERPDGLAADRLVDADIYALPGMEQGFHDAWKRLCSEDEAFGRPDDCKYALPQLPLP